MTVPSTVRDATALMISAVRDPNPVVYVSDSGFDGHRGDPRSGSAVTLGRADIKRIGSDVTMVAIGSTVGMSMEVAESLGRENISAEVIDLHTPAPIDMDRILESVSKTGRLVVSENMTGICSVASEIATTVASVALPLLKAPPQRVTREHSPLPFTPRLRQRIHVTEQEIYAAVRRVMRFSGTR